MGGGKRRKQNDVKQDANNSENSEDDVEIKPNPYYNLEFMNYCLVHLFPYAGILTRLVYEACATNYTTDTTNIAELYFRILKVCKI
jgi:hypothetical protein